MTEKLTPYDPAAALVNDEEIAVFMADALKTDDAHSSPKRWKSLPAPKAWLNSMNHSLLVNR